MARSPLLGRIQRLFEVAAAARRLEVPAEELIERRREETRARRARRAFLRASAGAAAAAAVGPLVGVGAGLGAVGGLAGCASTPPRRDGQAPTVAVVGGGLAGLHCAWRLRRAGLSATVFEASDRAGGRIFSRRDAVAPGLTSELGGSFIDGDHADMHALARELGLGMVDLWEDDGVQAETYYFAGQHRSEAEVLAALEPLLPRLHPDLEAARQGAEEEPIAAGVRFRALDALSLAAYLDEVGCSGWLRALLDVAFVTEFGLEADEQSALNLLTMLAVDDGFEAFGESDERYCIDGGNQRVVDALAEGLGGQVRPGRRLVRVEERGGGGLRLTFEGDGGDGGARAVDADYAVLALPFTLLREVALDVALPARKRRAIAELGYGTNAKLLLGFEGRAWRGQGYSGAAFSDAGFQLAWDDSRLQWGGDPQAGPAVMTLYSGGRPGVALGEGAPAEHAARLLPGLERVYPGAQAAHTGRLLRMHWPSAPYAKASYAAYRPGQWTGLRGAEGERVGRLLFAGEHCSGDFQGYMNGAAETGRLAAEELLAEVGAAAR